MSLAENPAEVGQCQDLAFMDPRLECVVVWQQLLNLDARSLEIAPGFAMVTCVCTIGNASLASVVAVMVSQAWLCKPVMQSGLLADKPA